MEPAVGKMRDAVLGAAARSVTAVRREALRARGDPARHLRHARLVDEAHGVSLYARTTKTRRPSTRVLGTATIHASIQEVVEVLSHKSRLSFPLMNPGLAAFETLHTLVDEPTRFVAVRSMAMHDRWGAPHLSQARAFVVMETQQAFETDDGRRGWAVSFHSLSWPGCPPPPRDAVRGSLYHSGIVALEATRKAEQIEIFCVAELKLKGDASDAVDWLAARNRVFDSLVLLTGTVEQRAVGALELLQTSAFRTIERHSTLGDCSLCAETDKLSVDDAGQKRKTYRCRKCCVGVCGACSAAWRRGQKEARLCMDCWGDATLQF